MSHTNLDLTIVSREMSRIGTGANIMLSAEGDVMEMQGLCVDLAALLTSSHNQKDKVAAVRGLFRDSKGRFLISWNRTLEFLQGRAHRVDSWEKDFARRELAELERLARERREHEHFNWLDELIASDPKLARRSAAELKHLLRGEGREGRAVAQAEGEGASQ